MRRNSSSSSDDDSRKPRKIVYVNNRCHCDVIRKESSAVLKNIVLEATVDLAVLEKIKIDVPMRTNCDVNIPEKPVVPEYKPPPPKPKPLPAAKVAYVGEVYKFTVEVKDLPRMDSLATGGKADPYFYFYLYDNGAWKMYYGGRDTALKNTRHGHWSFPLVASEVKLSEKIKIVWMDWDGNRSNDDEIGITEISVTQAISGIRLGGTYHESAGLKITGKRANNAVVKLIVNKQAEPKPGQTLNRTNSIKQK